MGRLGRGEIVMKTKVMVFGPNLRDQSKGQLHVHAANCADNRRYGNGRPMGGEEGQEMLVSSRREVVEDMYSGQLDEGCSYKDCAADVHFAPCLDGIIK